MRKVAELAWKARSSPLSSIEDMEGVAPPHNLTPKEKLVAATEAIIAAQQMADAVIAHNHPSGLPAAQALTKLTGHVFDHVNHVPQVFHAPLIALAGLRDSIDMQLEPIKASVEGLIHWESIVNTLYITLGVFFSWFIGYWNLGIGWVFVTMFFINAAYRRNMERIKAKIEVECTRVQGLKKLEHDVETVEWMNLFLDRFWRQFEPGLSLSLKSSIDSALSSSKPGFLDDLGLTKFTLGTTAPRIDQIRTILQTSDDTMIMELGLLFVPMDEFSVSQREREKGDLRQSKIEVVAKIGKGAIAIGIPVVVEEIEFRGNLRLELKFVSKYPHVSKIDYAFTDVPVVDFSLRPLKSLDIMDMPGLKASLDAGIKYGLSGFVSPNRNSIDLDAIMNGTGADVPVGVLKVIVHEAKGLKNVELAGMSDPYVLLKINSVPVARTKAIDNSLNPYWGQTLFIPIMSSMMMPSADAAETVDLLSIELFDDNTNSADTKMGEALPLKLSRWVKLLETPTNADQVTDTMKLPQLSAGQDLSSVERETLITEWGTPFDESGGDLWHVLSNSIALTSGATLSPTAKKRGEVRLEMVYLPLQSKSSLIPPPPPPASSVNQVNYSPSGADANVPISLQEVESLPGVLTATINSGKDLPNEKHQSLKVEVSVNGVEFPPNGPDYIVGTTPVVKKSKNPVWDYPVRFYVMDPHLAVCHFIVKDGGKPVAELTLKFSEILDIMKSKNADADWFKLENCPGKLRITFQWTPLDPAYLTSKSDAAVREPAGMLKLKLLKAKGLLNVEMKMLGRKSDPYIKINIGHSAIGATIVKENTLDPVWNETFYGIVYSHTQKLSFDVADFNLLQKDKPMGRAEIRFQDIIDCTVGNEPNTPEFEKWKKDGMRVDKTGEHSASVILPVYIDNESSEKSTLDKGLTMKKSDTSFSETKPPLNTPQSALLQRGFIYFELEYFNVKREALVVALAADETNFISRKQDELVKEVHRLKTLAEVKVLSPEVASERIKAVTEKGYVGEMDAAKLELLQLPRPEAVVAKYDSGILRFRIIAVKNLPRTIHAYVDIKIDEESVFNTRIQKNTKSPTWNATSDLCLRSFKFQKLTLILFDAKDSTQKSLKNEDSPIGMWSGSWMDLLGKKKIWIQLHDISTASDFPDVELNISLGFMPIEQSLSDTTQNTGVLYIDILNAVNLEAVDFGGASDPYCLIYLNDDPIHKTKVQKKNLNPFWNESVNCAVQSRLKSTLHIIVKDFNTIGKHTTLGTVDLDLAELKSGHLLNLSLPLAGARSGKLNLTCFFDANAKFLKKSESQTLDAASLRLEHAEDNAALKLTKGLGQGTIEAFKEVGKAFIPPTKQAQDKFVSATQMAKERGAAESAISPDNDSVKQNEETSDSMEKLSGFVTLTIEEAKDLKAVDDNGFADPYVQVNMLLHGSMKTLLKTKTVKKTLNPVWSESIQFKIPPSHVTLVLKDKNLFGSSKPLGEIELNLCELFNHAISFDHWFEVGLGGMGSVHVKGEFCSEQIKGHHMPRSTSKASLTSEHLEHEPRSRASSSQSDNHNKLGHFFSRKRT
ncbi:hypothetical protein BC830DRAFT_1151653 [Chytriomyces sp. MP71]|nr:hypothetical protein BC830DRAFT_1151653 [Chytriomyces sp. MP71]